jgi:hypothetical protein
MASSVRQMLEDAPYDAVSLRALLGRSRQVVDVPAAHGSVPQAHALSDEARQTLAWIDALVNE